MTPRPRSPRDLRAIANPSALPADLPGTLRAMWHAARGDWDRAHDTAQRIDDVDGAWVHAHLHRLEGDRDNAAYWYSRAGKPVSNDSLDAEWDVIVEALLARA